MSDGLASFRIEVGPLGHGKIVVNEEDVSTKVTGVEFQVRAGQPSLLTLHTMAATGTIDGEGIVQVSPPPSSQASLVDALSAVDAEWLSAEVLRRSGWGDDPISMALEILKEWAGGNHS